jgi:hypothetical protein
VTLTPIDRLPVAEIVNVFEFPDMFQEALPEPVAVNEVDVGGLQTPEMWAQPLPPSGADTGGL